MQILGLTVASLALSGCGNMSTGSLPSTPSAPVKAEKPADPSLPKPVEPTRPVAPKPEAPRTPEASKPIEAPAPAAPKPAAPIDPTPIKADLSKIKFTSEAAELFGYDDGEARAFFFTNGSGELTLKIPADGDYEIVVTASCQAAKGENAKFKLSVDGAPVGGETQLKSEDAKDYAFATALKAGERKIAVQFTNDMYKEGEYDLNFFLNGLKVLRVK
jgi:septal ring-binding cell division protein DamX